MNDIHKNDDDFDLAMRERYRLAADNLSAPTRTQLRRARHAAATDGARRRGFSWPLVFGGAAAAVFAVAFGLNLRPEALQTPDVAVPATVATADNYEEAVSALDQDPDFYAWLGSSDAELVAME